MKIKIDDQEVLLYVAKNDETPDVRKAALEKIDDNATLSDIMKYDKDMDVQRTALQRLITQEPALLQTLLSDNDEHVRRLAVEKITDEKKLLEIIKNDCSVRVRITAIHTTGNTDRLMEILQCDPNINCRHAAYRRLMEMADQLTWEKHMVIRIIEHDGENWIYTANLCPFCGGKYLTKFSWEEDYDFVMYTQLDCEECKERYVICDNITNEIENIKRVFGLK